MIGGWRRTSKKMLYDNALLVDLLTEVWLENHPPLYAARVAETVSWLLRDMCAEHDAATGGFAFAAAVDADSEGEEGRFYVWRTDEIDAVLGPDAAPFKRAYDVRPGGNWTADAADGHAVPERTILNRTARPDMSDPHAEAFLAHCRARLLAVRDRRIAPERDGKVLADWNGLAIAAIARAARVFERPDWLRAATAVFAHVKTRLTPDGRLRHSLCAGQARHPAVLDDYANLARAALILFEATGERAYRDDAETWVETVQARYHDSNHGGYYLTPDDADDLPIRPKTALDMATPAGNGVFLEVLARLYHLTGVAVYSDRAHALAAAAMPNRPEAVLQAPSVSIGWEFLRAARQVVIIGPHSDPATDGLWQAAWTTPAPLRIINVIDPNDPLPPDHPATGKSMSAGRPTAYVCAGPVCGPPVTDAAALRDQLLAAAEGML